MGVPLTKEIVASLGFGSLATTNPADIGTTASVGTGATSARSDHRHSHGNLPGGNLHALASSATAGFQSASHFNLLNGATSGIAPNTLAVRDGSGHLSANNLVGSSGVYAFGGVVAFSSNGAFAIVRSGSNDRLNVTHPMYGPAFNPTSDPDLKINVEAVSDDIAALIQLCSSGQIAYERLEDGARALGFDAKTLRDLNPIWVVGGEIYAPSTLGLNDEPWDAGLINPATGEPWVFADWMHGSGFILDGDGETWRTPLRLDPVAMLSSAFAAIRQLANDCGYAETQLQAAMSRMADLEGQLAVVTARLEALEAAA